MINRHAPRFGFLIGMLACFCSALLVALCLYLRLRLEDHKALFETVGAVFVCCFAVFAERLIIGKPLEVLGRHSSNIFLFHTFIVTYFFSRQLYSLHNWFAITLVLVLACLAISWVLEQIKRLIRYNELSGNVAEFFSSLIAKAEGKHHLSA